MDTEMQYEEIEAKSSNGMEVLVVNTLEILEARITHLAYAPEIAIY